MLGFSAISEFAISEIASISYTVTGLWTAPAIEWSSEASAEASVGGWEGPAAEWSGEASLTAPGFTAEAEWQLPAALLEAEASFAYTAEAEWWLPATLLEAEATSTVPEFAATGEWLAPAADFEGYAFGRTVGEFIVGAVLLSGTAEHIYIEGEWLVPVADFEGAAQTEAPVYEATAVLVAPAITWTGVMTPVFGAAAELLVPGTGFSGAVTVELPTAGGTMTLVMPAALLAGFEVLVVNGQGTLVIVGTRRIGALGLAVRRGATLEVDRRWAGALVGDLRRSSEIDLVLRRTSSVGFSD